MIKVSMDVNVEVGGQSHRLTMAEVLELHGGLTEILRGGNRRVREENRRRRFTDEEKAAMVQDRRNGMPNEEIVAKYNVTMPSVYRYEKEAQEAELQAQAKRPGRPRAIAK